MGPHIRVLRLVGDGASKQSRALALAEGEREGYIVRQSTDLAAALSAPAEGMEILVLLDARADDIKAAFAAQDSRGLPRWAVVPSPFEEGANAEQNTDEWHPAILARSIRSAVTHLKLQRDNARLRGDLAMIGRRLMHDLRTPLNAINMANEAVTDRALRPDVAPDLRQSIGDAVTQAGGLIDRIGAVLLASSKRLDLRPVDMEEVVWRARQKLENRIHSMSAVVAAPQKWPVVNAVPSLLEIVWLNLLANSLRHAGPAPHIEVGWTRSEMEACFWVRDSGPGVPVAKRPSLFHPLDRMNELNAPRGYGLPIVQRLIELLSGTTGYSPDPAPGGTFFFSLPAERH